MPTVPVHTLADPRHPLLADYANIRERQLAQAFTPAPHHQPAADPAAPFGKFMAEGEIVVRRLIASAFPVLSVLCTPERHAALATDFARLDPAVPVYLIPPDQLAGLVGFNLHRGLMAIGARLPPRTVDDVLAAAAGRPVLVLEDLANHDNIGACFRNAAAFNAGGLLLSPGCADPLYRKATRVAVGYTLTLPFARLEPWPAGLATLRTSGYRVVALTPKAPSIPLRTFAAARSPAHRLALLLGTEGPGLTDAALAAADHRVVIPMAPGVDSLNVAVAAAVALEPLTSPA